ncbi:MAG: class I SAM-dependent methyltransferase [Carbonactinosporaceae bacterium]
MLYEDRERALSFGPVADAYELGRPDYPAAAIDFVLGEECRRAIDLGAGTGKLTSQLIERGLDVVAVEPLHEMLRYLRQALPGAGALCGTAEAMPVRDGWADAVTAAQAFHWFDPKEVLPEIARVLRPGGVLGVLWNLRDDERAPWVRELSAILGREGFSDAWQRDLRAYGFGPAQHRRVAHEQVLDRPALIALSLSRSYVANRPPYERAEILREVERLWDRHPDLAGRERAVLPYLTHAFRARRTV